MYRNLVLGLSAAFAVIASAHDASAAKPEYNPLEKEYKNGHICDEKEKNKDKEGKPVEKWPHQCAIRLSSAMQKEGTLKYSAKSYPYGKCKHGHALRAADLAKWLGASDQLGDPTFKPTATKTKTVLSQIQGKKGIIFLSQFDDGNRVGDHIDLWDRNAMKTTVVKVKRLEEAEEVWFWELK